jgi:hypothetical protein
MLDCPCLCRLLLLLLLLLHSEASCQPPHLCLLQPCCLFCFAPLLGKRCQYCLTLRWV